MGGEEFLAVLPESGPEEARAAADRLRRAVGEAPVPLPGGGHVTQTVSVGLACAQAGAGAGPEKVDGLIERADRALYAAKAAGRDRVGGADAAGATGIIAPGGGAGVAALARPA
jgi:diguanylate cyclase (GGDEF)-like protein